MPEKQFATLTTEVKATGDADDRTLRFIGTTAARDRMGDEITLSGWDFKPFLKGNPVVQWAHDYTIPPVGIVTKITKEDIGNDKKGWAFDVKFAKGEKQQLAEQLYDLCQQGMLNAVSVGFQSHKSEWIAEDDETKEQRKKDTPDKHPGKRFLKKELLELSLVPVPANAEALQVARKKGMSLPKELNAALDSLALERASEALANTRQIKAQLAALGGNGPGLDSTTGSGDPEMDAVRYPRHEPTATSGYVHVEGTPIPPCEITVAPSALGITGPYLERLYDNQKVVVNQPSNDQVWIGDLPETLSQTADTIITKPGWDDDAEKNELAYRVREPGRFKEDTLKYATLKNTKPRINAVVGKLKGQDSLTIQSLRFPKDDGWDVKKAKAWVKEHPDVVKEIDRVCSELHVYSVDAWIPCAAPIAHDLLEEDTWSEADKDELASNIQAFDKELERVLEEETRDEAPDVALPEGETAEPALPDSDGEVDCAQPPTEPPALPPEENADNASDAGGPEYIRFIPEDDPEETLTILEG